MFTELHARSAFSFHRGSSSPEALMRRAAALALPGLAITDRDGVYGSARAHAEARDLGLRAIVGAEITLEDESVLPVLVRNRQGYQNLCRMLTTAKLRAAKNESRVTWKELAAQAEGLLCLTGDEEGPIRRALAEGDKTTAEKHAHELRQIFGPKGVAVELQRHRVRGERWMNRALVDLAAHLKMPIIASNGVCHAERSDRELLDAFTCLRLHTHLDEAGKNLSANAQRHLKNAKEMRALFADLPEAIMNTQRIAAELEFTLTDLGYRFPDYPVPPGHDMASLLRELTYTGAAKRYDMPLRSAVKTQLDHELALINKLGFPGYFLIVWDLMRWAKEERGIFCQGRGSAANSAVCYSLGITNVDPVGSGLLFERFLSEGRNSWPDIDIDFPSGDQRESVIQEVYRRFAPRGAAMTANVITYRGRSTMREMGKVLNLPEDILSRFSDLYGHGDYPHTIEMQDQLKSAGLPVDHPRLPALLRLCQSVYGMPRHLGQHSGGMIICNHGLDSIVPLEPASMPGRTVVQWDKDDCEDLGIIKVDLLGLGMLAAIEDTLAICAARGRPVDPARIPKDDPATYALMQRADTVGTFQIESRAQMATLPRMKPKCFYDVVIEVAIIRPGPIVGKLVHPYLNRRNGREPIDYIDPIFEPVLKRTLGVPLFQEQVLRMAMEIAGFNGSEAEELRRAMSFHRNAERMQRVMTKLRAAMTQRGVKEGAQERIVKSIQSFALYGFPESHAISFALISYASCWLKTHRPAEFYAGLLNAQPMGFYSPATLIKDAKHHHIRTRPACVVQSAMGCSVEDDQTIRLGLNQLRGINRETLAHMVSERSRQPWQNLEDFLLRTHFNKDERRILAKSGALKELATHRRDALWQVEAERDVGGLFEWSAAQESSSPSCSSIVLGEPDPRQKGPEGQPHNDALAAESLPGALASCQCKAEGPLGPSTPLRPMTPAERLQADYDALRLTTGPHPMAYLRDRIPQAWRASDLAHGKHGQRIILAGQVICRQRPSTAKGHLFISLEDETGIANAFVPSTTFESYRLIITQEPFLLLHGHLQCKDNVTSLYTEHIEGLKFDAELNAVSHDFH